MFETPAAAATLEDARKALIRLLSSWPALPYDDGKWYHFLSDAMRLLVSTASCAFARANLISCF